MTHVEPIACRRLRFAQASLASAAFIVAGLAARADDAAGARPIEAEAVKLGRPVDFEKDVAPILEANCLACHNAAIGESKLVVESAALILKGGKRGPAVIPKDPARSLLFQVASRAKQPAMPPLPNKVEANALSPRELGILKQWILEGAAGSAGGGADSLQWQPIPAGMKAIFSTALSHWGRYAAAGRANQVVVYDLALGEEAARLTDPALSEVQIDGKPMYPAGAADRDFIHALAFSPDETLLAAGGYRAVKLWRHPQNAHKAQTLLADVPTALAVSPGGRFVAVATADRTIQLVATIDGKSSLRLTGPSDRITCLEFSADGRTIFAGSLDKTCRAWSAVDGTAGPVVVTPSAVEALALEKADRLLTGSADGVIREWSLAPKAPAAKLLRELKGHGKAVSALAFVAGSPPRLVSGSADGTVRVWDLASGTQRLRVEHGGAVTALAVRADGQAMASAGTNKIARVWQMADGKRLAEMQGNLRAERRLAAQTAAQTIAVQHLAAADARVAAAGQELKDRKEALAKSAESLKAAEKALAEAKAKEKLAQSAVDAAKKAAQASPKDANLKKKLDEVDKALAAAVTATKAAEAGQAAALRAKDAADQALRNSEKHLKATEAEALATKSARKSADEDLVEARSAAAQASAPLRCLAFSADGKTLVTGGEDSAVAVWDARTGRALDSFTGHGAAVQGVAYAARSTIVSVAGDRKLIVWDANPPWTLVGRIGPKPEAPLDLSASPFIGRVLCLAFSADGKLLATGGGEPSRSGELKIWNVPALTLARDVKDAHSDTVFGVEFSRDGKYLASGAADKFVKVFEVGSGKLVKSFEGHTHHVLGVAWKADGTLLASAGADNQVKVWNFESGEQSRTITRHSKQVTSIQFIGTGESVVTSSGDKSVRLFRTNDGGEYRVFEGAPDFVYSAAAAPDESLVVAGGEDGTLRVWNGKDARLLYSFAPPGPVKDAAQASAARR